MFNDDIRGDGGTISATGISRLILLLLFDTDSDGGGAVRDMPDVDVPAPKLNIEGSSTHQIIHQTRIPCTIALRRPDFGDVVELDLSCGLLLRDLFGMVMLVDIFNDSPSQSLLSLLLAPFDRCTSTRC